MSTIRSDSGSVSITGTASSGTSTKVAGISVRDGFEIYGGAGVSLIGSAAGSTATGVSGGVYIADAKVTAIGAGGLTIVGTGGQLDTPEGTILDDDLLVPPTTAGILIIDGAALSTSPLDSPMTLTGIGGTNNNSEDFSGSFGVAILSPRLNQTTSLFGSDLPITITGTGGASVGHSLGILLGGPANFGAVTITGAQVINLTGTSGTGVADSEQPDAGIVLAAASGSIDVSSYYGQITLTGTAGSAPGYGIIVQDDTKLRGNGLSLVGTGASESQDTVGVLAGAGSSDTTPQLNAGSGPLTVLSKQGALIIDADYGGTSNTFTSPLGTVSSIANAVGPLSLFGGDFYIDPLFGITFDQVSVHDLTVLDGGAVFNNATVHDLTVAGDGFVSTGTINANTLAIVVDGIISLGTTNVATSALLDAGDISQTGALSTPILNITGTKGAYNVVLNTAENNISLIPVLKGGNFDIATGHSVQVVSAVTENLKLHSGGDINLGSTTATTALELGATGLISQTGSIQAGSLTITNSENTFLSNGKNSIETFGDLNANNDLSLYNNPAINVPRVNVGGELILSTPGGISTGIVTANSIFLQPGGDVLLGETVATESLTIDPMISDIHYPGISIQQEGSLTTGSLSILGNQQDTFKAVIDAIGVNEVTLTNSENHIGSLGDIFHNGDVTITSRHGLNIDGVISGLGDVTLQAVGGDLTIGALGNINALGNVTLVTDQNFINNVRFGSPINTEYYGVYYYIYAANPDGTKLGRLTPSVTQFNTTFPAKPLPEANTIFYASGAPQPPPPDHPTEPETTPEMVQAVITPQASQVAPQQVPPSRPSAVDAGDIFLPVSYTGNGGIGPIGTGVLADAYGNGGSVGSGDMVQLGGGGLNNSSNPAAAAVLDDSLSPVVRGNLDDALKGITTVTYAPVTTDTEDQVNLTAGGGGGNANEIIIGPEENAQIGGSTVKRIPANEVPQALQDALSNKVRNSLPKR